MVWQCEYVLYAFRTFPLSPRLHRLLKTSRFYSLGMNPYELVFLHRKCGKCGNEVPQLVFFNMEKGEIKVGTYWKHCVVCKAFLPKPTKTEITESPYFIDRSKV